MTSPKIYWLVAGQVTTANSKRGVENVKNFNVTVLTDDLKITRKDIAKAQDGLMRRFVTECPQIPGFKITDAFIMSWVLLGQMTHEEFNAGFGNEVAEAGG